MRNHDRGRGGRSGIAMLTPLLELRPSRTEPTTPVPAAPVWAHLGNVVPFAGPSARRPVPEQPSPLAVVAPAERCVPVGPSDRAKKRLAALLVASLLIHLMLLALLWRPPEPLPGIEL